MLGNAANTVPSIKDGLEKYGMAEGGRKMINEEMSAAQLAIRRGVYVTWRSKRKNQDCARVGHKSRCFCGHSYADHKINSIMSPCLKCKCKAFEYIPKRPEEVGDWWLVRRRGFNVHSWRAKCRCGCPHDVHDPISKACRSCSCMQFVSNFLCIGCDGKYEEHETVSENTEERRQEGRTVGAAFKPLSGHRDIQRAVFGSSSNAKSTSLSTKKMSMTSNSNNMSPEEMYSSGMIDSHQYFTMISSGSNGSLGNKPSPAQHGNPNESSDFNYANALTVDRHRQRHIMPKHKSRAERSVRLMHVSSGGQSTGKIMNRWGKTDKSERLLGRRSGSRLSAQSRAGKSTNNFK